MKCSFSILQIFPPYCFLPRELAFKDFEGLVLFCSSCYTIPERISWSCCSAAWELIEVTVRPILTLSPSITHTLTLQTLTEHVPLWRSSSFCQTRARRWWSRGCIWGCRSCSPPAAYLPHYRNKQIGGVKLWMLDKKKQGWHVVSGHVMSLLKRGHQNPGLRSIKKGMISRPTSPCSG